MPNLTLFVNTGNNTLMAGQKSSQTLDAGAALPLYFGDTLTLNIYLLQVPAGYNPNDPANSTLQTISTAGLTLFFYLDDGRADAGGTIYAGSPAFTTDPLNSFFIGQIALNTPALQTLIGTKTQESLWIKIGFAFGGVNTTVFSKQITIYAGLPNAAIGPVAPGLTALSTQVAAATYFPLNPVAGQPIYLESPNGKIFALSIIDNADGSASFQASQLN